MDDKYSRAFSYDVEQAEPTRDTFYTIRLTNEHEPIDDTRRPGDARDLIVCFLVLFKPAMNTGPLEIE